jgi:flavin reductase (DIM6/NTAB) family NADH-FMN oxidoreductase RutF
MDQRLIKATELKEFSRFYRGNLVNCLSGTKPAILIGSKNVEGQTNLALFSNIFHLGADPALMGFVQRPVGQSGDTYRNILATRHYTFNFVGETIREKAHQTSARYETGISEFEACGLTPEILEQFPAPFVAESGIKIGLRFVESIPIKLNETILVIGAIEQIILPNSILQEDGNIRCTSEHALSILGLEQYYTPNFVAQMPYAKV